MSEEVQSQWTARLFTSLADWRLCKAPEAAIEMQESYAIAEKAMIQVQKHSKGTGSLGFAGQGLRRPMSKYDLSYGK